MRRLWTLTFVLVLGSGVAARAQPEILAAARHDVDVLTSPELKGRGYEFGGHERAAVYLRSQFEAIGLEPVGGGYEQPFALKVDVFPEAPTFSVNDSSLALGHAFLPYASSGSGRVDANRVVRAGHGLVIPDLGVNDYEGLDPTGAVVVVEDGLPDALRNDTTGLARRWGTKDVKIQVAALQGARALVVLVDRLTYGSSGTNASLPVIEVLQSAWPGTVRQVALRVAGVHDKPFTSQNVLGRIDGTAVPDSILMITAHYDHQGSPGGDVYFPGANDNASGTALLLSLARYFQAHPVRYSLVFAAFSGEEQGLIGSQYFAQHPPIDLSRTRFLLNFDMVGSGEEGLMAVGGTDHPAEFALLDTLNTVLGLGPLRKRPNAPNSDHYPLTQRGVPAFFIYANHGRQPYHHVDDRPETLEWEDFEHAYDLARRFIEALAG